MNEDLFTGLVAGVVAAAIWAMIEAIRRWRRNRDSFGRLAGRYRIRPKLTKQSDLGTGNTAVLTVSGSILKVEFQGVAAGDSISGEIAMSEHFPRSGEGHYQHAKASQQFWGSGNSR